MRKYDSYKDSGIEWIGEIPSHWEKYRLGVIGKFTSSGIDKKLIDNEPEVKIINYTDIYGNGTAILDSSIDYMVVTTPQSKIDEHSVKKGDLIFTPSSETKEDIGLSAVVIEDLENTAFSYHVLRFQFDRNVDVNFKKYLCNNHFVLNHFSRNSQGTTRQTLGRNDFKNAGIILPPEQEQTAIAAYLDRKTAEIDELIADKKRLLELYEEEKTAIINQAVTKGINPDAPMKDSGIEWLGEIPEHWETVSLKWVSKIYSGGTPSKNNEDFWQNGTIPWLNSGTVNQFFITEPSEFITEEALNSSSAKWIPEHSIVIALAGQGKTKGMAAQVMFECTCNQSMGVIVPNDIIVNRFLLYYLTRNYQNIRNLGGGDKRDGINLEMVGGIPLPVIPLPEQAEIVRHIEDHSNLIDAKKAKTEKLIELLTEYRTALISEVVTGKIKVIE